MIVSHQHRFIFFKTRKTAGTSVEIALTPFCGPGDVLAALSPADELSRVAGGVVQARNYCGDRETEKEYARLVLEGRSTARQLLRTFSVSEGCFYNHMPAAKARRLLDPAVFQSYYKVTIERNPWDRMVSRYYWRTRTQWFKQPFSAFIRDFFGNADEGREDNFDIYSIDGKPVVDRIMRYEDLANEIGRLSEHLKLGDRLNLPNAKGGKRRNTDYRAMYSDEDRLTVAGMFKREIELLGYEF